VAVEVLRRLPLVEEGAGFLGKVIGANLRQAGRGIGTDHWRSLAWAGLANTYYWIDPTRDITGVILMQVMPFVDRKCLEAFANFEAGVYAGLNAAHPA